MSSETHAIGSTQSLRRRNSFRLASLVAAGLAAVTLAGCGGGGGGGSSNPPPPLTPTSSISIFAGNPNATGAVDGPSASAQFNTPTGVAVDPAGNFYVADNNNFTIRKISAGTVSTFAGSAGTEGSADGTGSAASFEGPAHIAISPAGNLYVTDVGQAVTVREITPAGQVTTLVDPRTGLALQTDASAEIAADHAGNIYVFTVASATGAHVLTQITPAGAVNVISLTTSAGTPLGLVLPSGLAVDSANNVYIAEENPEGNAGVLYKVTLNGTTGTAVTLAGSLSIAGASDGPGNAATFNGLSSLVVAPSGNIYANDYNNNEIREISPAGMVSTLAGTPTQYGLSLGPLPGILPSIDQLAWYGQSLYTADFDDNVILQLSPAP
jgi:DNA-binding beta-propeller fold protein YncE